MNWAQTQRVNWIKAKIDAREPFNREDLAKHFSCTLQTASATIKLFEARYGGALRYDETVKAFVPHDYVAPPKKRGWRAAVDKAVQAWEWWVKAHELPSPPATKEMLEAADKGLAEAMGVLRMYAEEEA
jgi:hypothetical protein